MLIFGRDRFNPQLLKLFPCRLLIKPGDLHADSLDGRLTPRRHRLQDQAGIGNVEPRPLRLPGP